MFLWSSIVTFSTDNNSSEHGTGYELKTMAEKFLVNANATSPAAPVFFNPAKQCSPNHQPMLSNLLLQARAGKAWAFFVVVYFELLRSSTKQGGVHHCLLRTATARRGTG